MEKMKKHQKNNNIKMTDKKAMNEIKKLLRRW
jgi:hypothetical protein